jgi:hypothetical protein
MLRPPTRLRPSILLLALVASLALAPVAVAAERTTDTSTSALANFLGRTSDPRICADVDIDASRFSEIPGSGTLTTMVFLTIRLFEAGPRGRCGQPPSVPLRSLSGMAGGGAVQFRVAKDGRTARLSGTIPVVEDDFETGEVFPDQQVQVNLAYRCIERQERTRQNSRAPDGSIGTTTETVTCDAEATGSIRSRDPETRKQRQFVTGPSVFAMIIRTVTRTVQRD